MDSQMLMGDGLRRNAWKFPLKIAAKDRSGKLITAISTRA